MFNMSTLWDDFVSTLSDLYSNFMAHEGDDDAHDLLRLMPESGADGNGNYTKFPDGTMICWHKIDGIGATEEATGGIFRSEALSWTYPIAFVAAPVVSVDTALTTRWAATTATPGTTHVSFRFFSSVDNAAQTDASLMAVGRWK